MRIILLATTAILGLLTASAATADEFNGGTAWSDNQQQGVNAYMDQQATNAQLADPTARDSIRSHGRP